MTTPINLWINAYSNPVRDDEFWYCWNRNIANTRFNKIYCLREEEVVGGEKIVPIYTKGRPTYNDYFKYINHYEPFAINVIANSDIYFDDTVRRVRTMRANDCYVLSWWQKGKLNNTRDCQDAWVFNGTIPDNLDCPFTQGVPGCDNALAYRAEQAGYRVLNPAKDIHAHHMHQGDTRTYTREQTVPRPYLLISPHHLGDEPVTYRLI